MAWLLSLSPKPCLGVADPTLTWWQRSLIGILAVAIAACGLSLAIEMAPSQELQSSLQAGWNVLHDKGMYDSPSNDFHSPPLIAIAAIPFGSPSTGISDSLAVPYPLTRALWFYLNVLGMWLATHWFVSLVESSIVTLQSWWLNRLLPLLFLIVPLADSLGQGSSDGLLLMVVAGLMVGLVRQQYFATGLTLAGALCLHLTALVLLFVPIWRRDRVMTLGIVFGLFLSLLLLPGLYFGLQRTNRLNEQYVEVLKKHEHQTMSCEQNNSLFGMVRQALPDSASGRDQWAIALALSAVAVLTLISCSLMGFQQNQEPLRLLHFIGSLLAIMLLASRQAALHSCVLVMPTVIGVLHVASSRTLSRRWSSSLMLLLLLMIALVSLPLHQPLLPLLGITSCWLLNAGLLHRSSTARVATEFLPLPKIAVTPGLPNAA